MTQPFISRGAFLAGLAASACASTRTAPPTIDVFIGGEGGYNVTSTIVADSGKAILFDAQFLKSDAERLADRIAAMGRPLEAIIITHPDADHFMGLETLAARFPESPIYMHADAITALEEAAPRYLNYMSRAMPQDAPLAVPTPRPLPRLHFQIGGEDIEIIPGLQGDFHGKPANCVAWIAASRTLIAADLAFDNVHLWLEESTQRSRAQWRADLARLEAMAPRTVIAGHQRDPAAAHIPAVLGATRTYLEEFERQLAVNPDAASFEAAMRTRYPDYAHPLFLTLAARSVYAPPAG